MHFRQVACVTLSLLLQVADSATVPRSEDRPKNNKESIECLSGSNSADDLADGIAKFLSSSTRSDLDRLVAVSDSTAAIAAGWERVRRTMPETNHEDVVTPDLLAITRFLGLIEGRVHVSIPKTWEATVKSAIGHSQKSIWFPPRPDLLLMDRHNANWRVEREGANWLVKNDRQLMKLPARNDDGAIFHAAVESAGEKAYVVLYGGLSHAYRVSAIVQGTGKVAWSSEVWGFRELWPRGVIGSSSGSDWHVVTMRSSGETLVVFGYSGRAVYVEVFDRKTGVNQCRFSTAYFDSVAPRG